MDNDYNRALSGYSQQLQELGDYADQKTQQIGQYNSQVKSAVSSYKKLAEGKTTNEFLSALAREGSAAGIRYLKQQLVKTDAAGKLTGKLGQGVGKIDKFLGKGEGKLQTAGKDIGNLGRRLAGKAEEAGGTEATELTGEAEQTLNFGEVDGELVGTGAEQTAATLTGDAVEGVETAGADIASAGVDAAATAGAAAETALTSATSVAGDVAGGALETLGGITEGAGDILDATGVGAILGVGLNIAGAAEGIYGAYEGGKGIYDFVKDDILGKGVEAAKESVEKVQSAITNVGNSIAIPTFDTAMNIHSSGAW